MKQMLTMEELDSQVALELPDRQMMLVTIVITNLLNNLSIEIPIQNNKVAVQVCAAVTALASLVSTPLDCEIQQ